MHNFYVAILNFKRFNGLEEVNTVFVLNFHYFHKPKNLKEIIKNFFYVPFKWFKNFDDNIILYSSFIVLKMGWWGGGNSYFTTMPYKPFYKIPNLIGSC